MTALCAEIVLLLDLCAALGAQHQTLQQQDLFADQHDILLIRDDRRYLLGKRRLGVVLMQLTVKLADRGILFADIRFLYGDHILRLRHAADRINIDISHFLSPFLPAKS